MERIGLNTDPCLLSLGLFVFWTLSLSSHGEVKRQRHLPPEPLFPQETEILA